MTAEFALHDHMGTFGEGAGGIGELTEGHAAMPLGARFPGSDIVLPGRLGGEREDRDVGCVGSLSFANADDETDKSDSIELHMFLLLCLFVSGTGKRVGAASQTRGCFSGETGNGGARTEGCESKAEASRAPGAAQAPKRFRDKRRDRDRDRDTTERITTLSFAAVVRYSVIQAIAESRACSGS
jgi:hypothetical protein